MFPFKSIAPALLDAKRSASQTIFVPNDYFPLPADANPGAQPIYDSFIDSLQTYLNASIDTRSFADIWNSSGTMDQVQQTIPLRDLSYFDRLLPGKSISRYMSVTIRADGSFPVDQLWQALVRGLRLSARWANPFH